jgi:hypothetical protein
MKPPNGKFSLNPFYSICAHKFVQFRIFKHQQPCLALCSEGNGNHSWPESNLRFHTAHPSSCKYLTFTSLVNIAIPFQMTLWKARIREQTTGYKYCLTWCSVFREIWGSHSKHDEEYYYNAKCEAVQFNKQPLYFWGNLVSPSGYHFALLSWKWRGISLLHVVSFLSCQDERFIVLRELS